MPYTPPAPLAIILKYYNPKSKGYSKANNKANQIKVKYTIHTGIPDVRTLK